MMSDNHDFDTRLSRLETIIDTIVSALSEIKEEVKSKSKVDWAPIAIGVTIFFTVCGAVATIYNTRIATLNTAVEEIANKSSNLEKSSVEHQLRIQSNSERINRLEADQRRIDDRLRTVEQR